MANESKVGIVISGKNESANAFKQVDSQLVSLQKSVGGLIKGAGLAALAAGLLEVGKAAFQLARDAAMVDEVRVAFDDLARGVGASGDRMLSALSAAAKGTISQQALMLASNKAMLLGVADTADEMSQLMQVAIARGNAMGLSTEQAFSDLVTGIGRMSPLILDNLGIVTGGEKVFDNYAASLGRTAESLTDLEKKQALVNLAVSSSADLVENLASQGDTAAEAFQRMDAAAANAKDALGTLISPAAAALANAYANDLKIIADMVNKIAGAPISQSGSQDELFASGAKLTDLAKQIADINALLADPAPLQNNVGLTIVLNDLQSKIADVAAEYNTAAAALGTPLIDTAALSTGVVQFTEVSQAAAIAIMSLGDSTDSTVPAIGHLANMAAQAAPNLAILRGQILDLVEAERALVSIADAAKGALESSFKGKVSELGVSGALSGFQAANAEVQATIISLKAQGKTQEEIDFTVAGIVDRWRDVNSQLGKTSTAVAQVDSAFEELKSKVASVLSGALNVDVGVNADDLLPRQDAINEDARRLADVAVNGFASPWADYLNNKFPELFGGAFEGGDLKTAAAKALKDFEDGLKPQLIDKDKAKERVKRMILGDASMAELAAQVTAELQAEMGGNAPADLAAKVQAALGGGGTGGAEAGADFANTTLDAVITSDVGGNMVATVVNQAANKAALLKTSGASNGKLWGDAFLGTVREGVPGALVAILVSLVLPEILAKLAASKSAAGTVD